jgi:hypothetical protein
MDVELEAIALLTDPIRSRSIAPIGAQNHDDVVSDCT